MAKRPKKVQEETDGFDEEEEEEIPEAFKKKAISDPALPKSEIGEDKWELVQVPQGYIYKLVNQETGEELVSWKDILNYLNELGD